jgi:hypothetical protein
MIVKIVESAGRLTAEVDEPNAFKGLHVEVPSDVASDAVGRLLVAEGIGDLVGDDAVVLSIGWLRSHADDHSRFDAWFEYAATKGWVLPDDTVRAHLVRN